MAKVDEELKDDSRMEDVLHGIEDKLGEVCGEPCTAIRACSAGRAAPAPRYAAVRAAADAAGLVTQLDEHVQHLHEGLDTSLGTVEELEAKLEVRRGVGFRMERFCGAVREVVGGYSCATPAYGNVRALAWLMAEVLHRPRLRVCLASWTRRSRRSTARSRTLTPAAAPATLSLKRKSRPSKTLG